MAEEVPGVTLATASPLPDARVPRLVRALNEVTPPALTITGATNIERHLRIINQRLLDGLDPMWTAGEAAGLWDGTVWRANNEDEQWARKVTEMLFGTPYFGPHQIVSRALPAEPDVYRRFLLPVAPPTPAAQSASPPPEPMLPLGFACQHSVSIGIITRGFDAAGITKSGRSDPNVGCEPLNGFAAYDWKPRLSFTAALSEGIMTPGSAVTWADFNHAAFVLRVDPQNRFAQLLDTGAVGGPCLNPDGSTSAYQRHNDVYVMKNMGVGGLYDDPARRSIRRQVSTSAEKIKARPDAYLGIGIARPGNLTSELARIRSIRPIGLGRLIVRSRQPDPASQSRSWVLPDGTSTPIDPQVLFVSKLLPMYGSGLEENFWIARLAWSLRNLPGTAEMESRWVVISPNRELALTMLAAPRAERIEGLQTRLGRNIRSTDLKIITALADEAPGAINAKFQVQGPVIVKYRVGVGTTAPVREEYKPVAPGADNLALRNPLFSYLRTDQTLPDENAWPDYIAGRSSGAPNVIT